MPSGKRTKAMSTVQDVIDMLQQVCEEHGFNDGLVRATSGTETDAEFDLTGATVEPSKVAHLFVHSGGEVNTCITVIPGSVEDRRSPKEVAQEDIEGFLQKYNPVAA